MATIGHSLVGAALAAVPVRPRTRDWIVWWPGTLVLGANFLDTGEWLTAVTWARWGTWHMLHNWLAACGCAAGGSFLLWLFGRVKNPGPHVLLWIAVMSHLLMDSYGLSGEIRRWYRDPPPNTAIDAKQVNLAAEIWFYGLLPVGMLLLTVIGREDRPIIARRAAVLFLVALLPIYFMPFVRWLWAMSYAACVVFAVIVLRPRIRLKWLINGLFIAPIIGLATVELWSIRLVREGESLSSRGDTDGAIARFREANRLPTRTDKTILWWKIGLEQERAGRLQEAEKSFTRCKELDREWHWSELELASFYARHFSPKNPRVLSELREALRTRPEHIQRAAREMLNQFHLEP